MNKDNDNTIISLELLLLNDLFRTRVIDKDIYDKAVQKIVSIKRIDPSLNQQPILASA